MFTSSAREAASIFCIMRPRCAFTVTSLMPRPPPTCLFSWPPHHQGHDFAFAGRERFVTVAQRGQTGLLVERNATALYRCVDRAPDEHRDFRVWVGSKLAPCPHGAA